MSKKLDTLNATLVKQQAALAALNKKADEAEAAIAKTEAAIAAAKEEGQFAAALEAGLPVGTSVTASYGRGDTVRTVTGIIKGFKPAEGKVAAAYALETGTGFDTQTVKVPAANITGYYQLGEQGEVGTFVTAPVVAAATTTEVTA